jgi:UDP-glucuronate 4-epimerase
MSALLVTGAAGFIGMHVCERLLARGDQVVGLDNLNDYYPPQLKRDRLARLHSLPGFTFLEADVAHADQLGAAFAAQRFDCVIHLAAQAGVRYSLTHPAAYLHSNLTGFGGVLEACRQQAVGHLVYASTSSVYGSNTRLPFSEHHAADHPVSLYAATKRANELMAHAYSHVFRLPTTGLRFFTVYGPWGRPDMAPCLFARAILAGEPIEVFNQGRMARDFTYIDDIVEALLRIADRPAQPDPDFRRDAPDPASSDAPWRLYNIGNHTPVALDAFIAALEHSLGRPAQRRLLPMQPGDVESTCADVADLAAAVDFAPRTPLAVGIERFAQWYRSYHLP